MIILVNPSFSGIHMKPATFDGTRIKTKAKSIFWYGIIQELSYQCPGVIWYWLWHKGYQIIPCFFVLFFLSNTRLTSISNIEEDNCWKFICNLFMPFIITCRSRGVDVSGFRVFDDSGLRGSTTQAKALGTVDVSLSHVVGDIKKRQSDGAQL